MNIFSNVAKEYQYVSPIFSVGLALNVAPTGLEKRTHGIRCLGPNHRGE